MPTSKISCKEISQKKDDLRYLESVQREMEKELELRDWQRDMLSGFARAARKIAEAKSEKLKTREKRVRQVAGFIFGLPGSLGSFAALAITGIVTNQVNLALCGMASGLVLPLVNFFEPGEAVIAGMRKFNGQTHQATADARAVEERAKNYGRDYTPPERVIALANELVERNSTYGDLIDAMHQTNLSDSFLGSKPNDLKDWVWLTYCARVTVSGELKKMQADDKKTVLGSFPVGKKRPHSPSSRLGGAGAKVPA